VTAFPLATADPVASFPDKTAGVTPFGRIIEILTPPTSVPVGTFAVLTLIIALVGTDGVGEDELPPPPHADNNNVKQRQFSAIRNILNMLEEPLTLI